MRIGILSDTHGRQQTAAAALRVLGDRKVNVVLHCGDIDDVETVRLFQGFTAHFVYGNCDFDRAELVKAVQAIGGTMHGACGQLELEGVKIAFLHGDDKRLMNDVEQSGHFEFLFYGHTHEPAEHRTGPTRVINPGALHRARPKTFVVLDLASREVETVTVGSPV
jgi:putative phosphoesterase